MGERAHTPGPWAVGFSDGSGPECITAGDDTAVVMGGNSFGTIYGVKNPANARLIAAAPDMFEALRNAAGLLDTPLARRRHLGDEFYADVVASIRLALAKACPSESSGSVLADATPSLPTPSSDGRA